MQGDTIINIKMALGLILIFTGIIFITLSGLGIINFATATVELGPTIRVINSSPGIVLVIIGWLIVRSIKVIKEVIRENGREKIIGLKTK